MSSAWGVGACTFIIVEPKDKVAPTIILSPKAGIRTLYTHDYGYTALRIIHNLAAENKSIR